jgi:ATP-dependent helicase/nuclease subunit A
MTSAADATAAQNRAAAPGQSVWVSANAGSGKTKVLTDRVARLLLAGTAPQHILCLTYTKAAAAEMQVRLFKRLGEWAMMDAEELKTNLVALGEEPGHIDSDRLRAARRLFARALETPGGLKIQTIHSFCAALLRRFPLEAGVSPRFTEMEDRAGKRLRAEIVEDLAERHGGLFDALARHLSGEDTAALTAEIAANRAAFAAPPDPDAIRAGFGVPPGYGFAQLWDAVVTPDDAALLAALSRVMAASSMVTDSRAADRVAAIDLGSPGPAALRAMEALFLTGEKSKAPFSAKIGTFPTRESREALGSLTAPLDALMQRVEEARPRRLALDAVERALALHGFAHRFVTAYEARKAAHGLLDFDDLILKARDLLSASDVAQWVLYRLDGGLDHILVDEAQDTSPAQWQVISRLAEEFTAGEGARPEVERTIFVVGDEKQSIYSFQGADPEAFSRIRTTFAEHLHGVGKRLDDTELLFSFRSSAAVLRVVDATFAAAGGGGVPESLSHRAFKDIPGRVDLWPFVEKSETPEAPPWYEPVDTLAADDPAIQLADRIAGAVRGMLARGEQLTVQDRDGHGTRPIRPEDILILVQKRSQIFHEIIRALKAAELPVAGADRLKIGGELAVKDLTALLSFLATQDDDLSLAAALRSPLLGLSEDDLFRLAHGRAGTLWAALRTRGGDWPEPVAMLTDLRDATDFARPYELLERILTRHGGRERLLARLGREAEDGIDALLAEALAYERAEVPSLTGFLGWLGSGDVEVKRRTDAASGEIRVMTAHGAKGLEAPVVILPDTAQHRAASHAQILPLAPGVAAWAGRVGDLPPVLAGHRDDLLRRQQEERMRLLYVAMTRAENWLIVCGGGDRGKDGACWYDRVEAGLRAAGATETETPDGRVLRHAEGTWPAPCAPGARAGAGGGAAAPAPAEAPPARPLPAWARAEAATPPRPEAPRAPSELGGDKVLAGETADDALPEAAAKRRGRQIHTLLEVLPVHPPEKWPEVAGRLLASGADRAEPGAIPALLAEAAAVLDAPGLAPVFAPGGLAEVGIAAPLDALGGGRILGYVDRLIVEPGRVLAVDFKSNAIVPTRPEDVPEGLLRQMGAYAAALGQVYPDRRIETAILWTRTAELMVLPAPLVAAALARAGAS